jgi:hypothetical protein
MEEGDSLRRWTAAAARAKVEEMGERRVLAF